MKKWVVLLSVLVLAALPVPGLKPDVSSGEMFFDRPESGEEKISPILEAEVKSIDSAGYTVAVRLAEPGAWDIEMPSWTVAGGQDDLVWHTVSRRDGTAVCRVDRDAHNRETGEYRTCVMVCDQEGHSFRKTVDTVLLPFTDVTGETAYYQSIADLYDGGNGIMKGTRTDRFSPDKPVTRAELVTLLFRHGGGSWTGAGNVFSDVPDKAWYSEAVGWASDRQLVYGYEDGTFRPNRPVSTEEFFLVLERYRGLAGGDGEKREGNGQEEGRSRLGRMAEDGSAPVSRAKCAEWLLLLL